MRRVLVALLGMLAVLNAFTQPGIASVPKLIVAEEFGATW